MAKARGIFQIYKKVLARRPYLVQAIQTGALMGAGDIISQTLIEKKSIAAVDFKRTLQFSSIGFFVGGPALRVWYGLLNKHVGASGKTVAMKKVFVDQFIFAPTFLFFILVAVGKTGVVPREGHLRLANANDTPEVISIDLRSFHSRISKRDLRFQIVEEYSSKRKNRYIIRPHHNKYIERLIVSGHTIERLIESTSTSSDVLKLLARSK
ncbi:jg2901 [Pararge aegeria aegeria]|uniref:Mitochondrial inner membrane protein Mpv17 n=1 Tax=Pararge aegeria aegeria TaxID=348720 RepID=A0A8S4SES0_9NEOP|nr:jg2901 [Pararge aegeria aegeria]